jgi:transcriptional regulator with XRE-family HTH domain
MADKLDKDDLKFKAKIVERLRQIRESTGKNQTEFAYELNVDRQVISRIESGGGTSIYMIRRYCKQAGLSVKEFFDSPLFKGI